MAGEAGLCGRCAWVDAVRSARGSTFLRCMRSETEPERFAKYPRLPRYECTGFEVAREPAREVDA